MDKQFWDERWRERKIGFHEAKPNDLLAAHGDRIGKAQRVLVPLAGKTFDLRWLAEHGHDVVGVEFVETAVTEFFTEWGVSATPHHLGAHPAFYGRGVTLARADIFDCKPETLGRFDAIYDRAALVAIDPAMRERYVQTCRALLNGRGGIFLIAFAYDQTKTPGPPWSVDEATIRTLYAPMKVELLERRSLPTHPGGLKSAGVDAIEESAYWICG
jgi:thiopurine S-methyltransferase